MGGRIEPGLLFVFFGGARPAVKDEHERQRAGAGGTIRRVQQISAAEALDRDRYAFARAATRDGRAYLARRQPARHPALRVGRLERNHSHDDDRDGSTDDQPELAELAETGFSAGSAVSALIVVSCTGVLAS